MNAILDRAEAIATALRADESAPGAGDGIRASTDVRDTVPPCILVVPVPAIDYAAGTLAGGIDVTWTILALAPPPADLEAARELIQLADHVAAVLEDVGAAIPVSYAIPSTETVVPAYQITVTETIEE